MFDLPIRRQSPILAPILLQTALLQLLGQSQTVKHGSGNDFEAGRLLGR